MVDHLPRKHEALTTKKKKKKKPKATHTHTKIPSSNAILFQ
jgi:hypothetical protein